MRSLPMAVTIAIAGMTSFMSGTASFGRIWTRMVIRMSILSPVEGIFLGCPACIFLRCLAVTAL